MFGVTCSKRLGLPTLLPNLFLSLFFLYKEHKQNPVKFKYIKSLTKNLNHLDLIKWHRRCESDFLVDKYEALLYLKKLTSF